MNRTVTTVLAGIGGAFIGSVATYILMKKRFENNMEEQLTSVRKEFEDYMQKKDAEAEKKAAEDEKKKVDELVQSAVKAERDRIQKKVEDLNYGTVPKKKGPYLIDRGGEEFGGYMAVSLEYYSDGILLDGTDVIDNNDADEIVGIGNLTLLSNDKPLIWVRNEARRVDYEISYIDEDYYPSEE